MLQITPETETPADAEEKTDDALYCAGCGHLVTRGRWKILMGGAERAFTNPAGHTFIFLLLLRCPWGIGRGRSDRGVTLYELYKS